MVIKFWYAIQVRLVLIIFAQASGNTDTVGWRMMKTFKSGIFDSWYHASKSDKERNNSLFLYWFTSRIDHYEILKKN